MNLLGSMVIGFLLAAGIAGCSGASAADEGGATTSSVAEEGDALFGINVDPKNEAAYPTADEVHALGATRVRLEIKVEHADLGAAYRVYDEAVKRYRDAGIGVLLTIDYATLDQAGYAGWDAYVSAFASRAGAIAKRYSAVGYELWNEEDFCKDRKGYCPKVEVGAYAALAGAAARAIHDARPGATVVTGGLASGDWQAYARDLKSAMGADWDQIDGFGIHPYTFWPDNPDGNDLSFELSTLSSIVKKPLWLTEWGDSGAQAECVARYFRYFGDPGHRDLTDRVGSAFLFAWSSTQEDGNFGVVGRDGKRTAAWTKFHDAATSRGESEHAKESGDGQGSAAAVSNGGASNASRLHGAVDANGDGIAGLTVSAWGHANGDYHEATTDALGIYAFEGLDPSSQYNLVVNATFDGAGYTPIDEAHASATRDNVKLTAGGDGWHGENFDLGF